MRHRALILASLAAALPVLWSGGAGAHGAHCRVERGAVMIEATYHDGSPMEYCEVTVRAAGAGQAVITGSTDGEGRFCFLPAGGSDLSIEVDDGMGHIASARVEAGRPGVAVSAEERSPAVVWPVTAGVGAVFGLAGIYMMIRQRKG